MITPEGNFSFAGHYLDFSNERVNLALSYILVTRSK